MYSVMYMSVRSTSFYDEQIEQYMIQIMVAILTMVSSQSDRVHNYTDCQMVTILDLVQRS